MTTLLVIVHDRVSAWVDKGEVVDRYFNPANVFDHIDLLVTNDDRPDGIALERMAGDATIAVHNLPASPALFVRTLGWQPRLLRGYAGAAVELARRLRPDVVRCHGVRLNAHLASRIKAELGIPYIVSIHLDIDADHLRARRGAAWRRVAGRLVEPLERDALWNADLVLPVYESIVPYLRRLGVERWRVVYNVVGHGAVPKSSWAVDHRHVRAITVGRQSPGEKDPLPLVDAVAAVPGVHLHVIGDGPLHDEVAARVAASGASERFTLTRSLPNDEVVRLLAAADLFLYHSNLHELSKGCIEAALTGLPIVLNDRGGQPAPELVGDHVLLVDGSPRSYSSAIRRLIADDADRERLGRRALDVARQRWDPAKVEADLAAIYRSALTST